MTVPVTNATDGPYVGNGATTAFPFTFRAMSAAEVGVYVDGVAQTSGLTVALNANGIGGTVTFAVAPASGTKIVPFSNPSFTQDVAFTNSGPFLAETIDEVADAAAVRDIALNDKVGRALSSPSGESGLTLPSIAGRAGNLLGFDLAGAPSATIASSSVAQAIIDVGDHETRLSAEEALQGRALHTIPGQSFTDIDKSGFVAKYWVGDAAGNPVPSAGTVVGGDATLRTDLAANTGFTLIKYKNADANAFGRSGAQLKAMGAEESDGLSLINFIDPSYDDELLANAGVPMLDTAFTNALANLSAAQASSGRKTRLLMPGFVYPIAAALNFSVPDLVVDGGRAAKITSTFDGKAFGLNGARSVLRGIHFDQAATGVDPAPYSEHNAAGGIIESCTFTRSATAHIPFYVRSTAAGGRMWNNTCTWYGGVNIISDVSDFEICGNSFTNPVGAASDDGIAIKATGAGCRNIRIHDNFFNGMADFVGIGSEIGVFGTTDPTYSHTVEGISIRGNHGIGCARMVFIKPGAVDGVDYRDGTVRGVTISDNTLTDMTGAAMLQPLSLSVGRGARIIDVTGKNNRVIGRGLTGGANLRGESLFWRNDGTGTADGLMDNIDVGMEVIDPYNGVANGVLVNGVAAPGAPLSNAFYAEKANTAHGTGTRIVCDMIVNGTASSAITVLNGLDDAVHVRRFRGTNLNTGLSTNSGGMQVYSRMTVGTEINMEVLGGFPYKIYAGSVTCPELSEDVVLFPADIAAGTAATVYPCAAKRRSQLVGAKIGLTNTPAPSDTNYTSIQLKNKSGTDVVFAVARTKVTPFGGNDIAIAPVAGLRTSIFDWVNLTNDTQRAQTLFSEGQTVHVDKVETGTGAALNGARVSLAWVPY